MFLKIANLRRSGGCSVSSDDDGGEYCIGSAGGGTGGSHRRVVGSGINKLVMEGRCVLTVWLSLRTALAALASIFVLLGRRLS